MGLNLDKAIEAGDLVIQHRIRRFDVNWGRPPYALTYKRLVFSLCPLYHWGMENTPDGPDYMSVNWGLKGSAHHLDYYVAGAITWATGEADPTDNAADFNASGYARTPTTMSGNEIRKGYTVVAWIKPDSYSEGSTTHAIYSNQRTFNTQGNVSVVMTHDGAGEHILQAVFNGVTLTATEGIALDEWTMVAVTAEPTGPPPNPAKTIDEDNPRSWSTSITRLYVNGALVAESDALGPAVEPYSGQTSRQAVGTVLSNNNHVSGFQFPGAIDEVSLFGIALTAREIEQLFVVGAGLSYIEPDENFDTDVIGEVSSLEKYRDIIRSSNPLHYWTLDSIVANQFVDEGSSPTNINARGRNLLDPSALDPYDAGPIHSANGAGKWRGFGSDGDGTGAVLSYDKTAGSLSDFTVAFWYKNLSGHGDEDGIIGYAGYPDSGFAFTHQGSRVRAYIYNNFSEAQCYLEGFPNDEWVHLALVANKAKNKISLYVNGVLHMSAASAGFKVPAGGNMFLGGRDTNQRYDDHGNLRLDEIAMWTRALTSAEINEQYFTAKRGPYRRRIVGGEGVISGSPFLLSATALSTLTGEEDITQYVDTYSVDTDIKQIVPTASLTMKAGWGVTSIYSKLRANTYVIIDRRFESHATNLTTDWEPLGHFLTEGPIGSQMSAAGDKTYVVSLKGVTKLLSLDLAHHPVEGDKLFQPKVKLDYSDATLEQVKYKLRHRIYPDQFYQNWAETPSVRLWITDFQNLGTTEDRDAGGVNGANDVLRIKGSEGSVRILGGEGAVVINRAYLEDKVNDNGLGNPSTILAEFYRYADETDVETATVQGFSADNRYQVAFVRGDQIADNKTLIVKSGEAKGKIFKVRHSSGKAGDLPPLYTLPAYAANNGLQGDVARSGSYASTWTYVSESTPYWRFAMYADNDTAAFTSYLRFKFNATTTPPATIADNALLTGVQLRLGFRYWIEGIHWYGTAFFSEDELYLTFDGSLSGIVSKNLADKAVRANISNFIYNQVRGTGADTALLPQITYAQFKSYLGTMAAFVSFRYTPILNNAQDVGNIRFEVVQLDGRFTFADQQNLEIVDINGYPVNPQWEGLAVGDSVQIGDYNAPEDALRKVLARNMFQEADPDLPFYMELAPAPSELSPIVPPIRPQLDEQSTGLEIVEQILQACPPNYRLAPAPDGVTRGQLIGFIPGSKPQHRLVGGIDANKDTSDYGVITRIIAQGESGSSVNVALASAGGGTAAVRAYALDGYAGDYTSGVGVSLTQAEANDTCLAIFDGSPKTPYPGYPARSVSGWRDGASKYYGTLFHARGGTGQIKRWTFEDTALCALDIGRSATGTPIMIAAIEVTTFNHYVEGNHITQSMYVYGMTEEDYRAEHGVSPPDTPNQDDTNYFPPADSRAWKLLVDEFATKEPQTTVESSDFEGGRPVRVRFLKFVIGQAHYRFPVIGSKFGEDDYAIARINIADIKVYNSGNIFATAELGVTDPFGGGEYRQLASRLRRRTEFLDKNLTLDTYDEVRNFAAAELQERLVDFAPIAVTAFAPTVEAGEIVTFMNVETRLEKDYLVIAVTQDQSGVAKMQLLNYDVVLESEV